MAILVFKTNLSNPERIGDAGPIIENIGGVQRWNVDLHDCDNVLRIEALALAPETVSEVLTGAGYYCEELGD